MSNHKQINLPLHDISVGGMLQELVRAYLYTGNPSALLGRIADGIRQHVKERGEDMPRFDREALGALQNDIDGDKQHLKELEDKLAELDI